MTKLHTNNLTEYKIKAAILLKNLWSLDPTQALVAAVRFQKLPHLINLSAKDIVLKRDSIKLKHALNIIALENNLLSWSEFKHLLEKRDAMKNKNIYTLLYPKRCGGFSNEWYANYQVAKQHLEQVGGYLLPYKNHFFICTSEYIKTLGLDPNDPDWKAISWDWVHPTCLVAWQRLNSQLETV